MKSEDHVKEADTVMEEASPAITVLPLPLEGDSATDHSFKGMTKKLSCRNSVILDQTSTGL